VLYVTTRNKDEVYTAHKALTESRASDGGFYVPFHMPVFSAEEIASLEKKSFGHCVAEVLNKLFGTQFTAWDIDCTVGRAPIRLNPVTQRIAVGELWHNLNWDFQSLASGLTELVSGGTLQKPSDWTLIGIRIAVLFGIFGKLMRRGMAGMDNPMDIAVFSGDFSGPMALWYAREMGLPVGNIIVCCNENNNPWELLHHGAFRTGTVAFQTITPEGDFVVPTDLERFVFACGGETEVTKYLEDCRRGRMYVPSDACLERMRAGMYACVVGQSRVASAVPNVYSSHGCVLEPYTALIYCGLMDYHSRMGERRNALIFSEHSPYANPAASAELMGITPEKLKEILNLQ